MKIFHKKLLSASVSTALTLTVCSAIPMGMASDIEIYKDSQKGKTSILLMLDTSGSMGISSLVVPSDTDARYGSPGDIKSTVCQQKDVYETSGNSAGNILEYQYNAIDNRTNVIKNGLSVANTAENGLTKGKTSFYKEVRINGTTVPYYVRGCGSAYVDETTGRLVEVDDNKFDRLSRLKDAILTLLADTTKLDNDIQIGLGHYSSQTNLKVGSSSSTIKLVDGHSGTILVPVNKLTPEHRLLLAQQIAKFQSVDTTTKQDGSSADTERVGSEDRSKQRYSSTNPPADVFKASSGTPTAHAYAEAGAYMMGTRTRDAPSVSSHIQYIYDGASTVRNGNEQIYFICVEAKGKDVANDATTLGANYVNVKQCINAWPSLSGGKLHTDTKNTMLKPNGSGGWIKPTELEISAAFGTGDISNWEMYTKMPIGWRYGGWMRVPHEPMDIEPVTASPWKQTGADRNLVSYRVNPFSLHDKMSNNKNAGYDDNLGGGFSYSHSTTKENGKYKAGGSTNSCDGNGIYFLTDGAPNSTKDGMARAIMNDSLVATLGTTSTSGTYGFQTKPSGIGVLSSPPMQSQLFEFEKGDAQKETGGWEYIGEYAKKLKNKLNPSAMSIKTAVVGFGATFAGIPKKTDGTYDCEVVKQTNVDAYNACMWGQSDFGDGGFYYAENSEDISKSIVDFVKKVEVNIDPVVTGTPTVPVDALNPTELQNHAYYASFQPTVSSSNQLWVGNLNKYKILNGELYSESGLQRLINSNGSLNTAAQGFWTGGALGQLEIGAEFKTDGEIITKRKVYTNRVMSGATAAPDDDLHVVDVDALFDGDFKQDADKNYWLNALGFDVNATQTGITKSTLATYATDRRLGAVMHSTPVLLTQEGRVSNTGATLTTSDRKDYLMYGSTQGILHVVDVSTGKEVFGFLPHEIMEKQKTALLLKDQTAGGTSNLFYGVDAPWVAHTQYTTKNNGLLTVKESDRTETDEEDSEAFLKGHQWVYGGLRMGGKSYYALNLTDIDNPKMMFHINPSTSTLKPLQRMGQSWSKPTLGYVRWGDARKLVMFVGGGYDAEGEVTCASDSTLNNKGYECPTYTQTNKIGAGVYMFDAQNGDLLWWTSVDNNDTPTNSNIRFTANTDLQYSVVSQINAIDRNADGLVDHLYFGDLAGQAFRVDLNNNPVIEQPEETDPEKREEAIKEAKKNAFATRTVTLFTEHSTDGLSPRYYEMPSVSVHTDTDTGALFAAVAFSSGNRSSPLAESTQSAKDGVFVVYDNDVAHKDLYQQDYVLKTKKDNVLQLLVLANGVDRMIYIEDPDDKIKKLKYQGGWKHSFSDVAGTYKGMNDIYALDGMLYVNVFHKDGTGISGSCGGGVKGDSYLYQYCLPYGKCDFYTESTSSPNRVKLGAGILGTGIGQGYNNKINTLGLIVNRDNPTPTDCSLPANKNLPQCQLFDNTVKLKQLRWYESR